MTLKRFDDLVLQVFESSEKFFFPIVSQRQAKAFVKVLHSRGLEYNIISDEINETLERFSTWRKNLSCSKVGQRIIQRINHPFYQILQEGQDVNSNFETFFYVEPDFFSFEKQNVTKNSRLWRFLNRNKRSNSSRKKKEKFINRLSDNSSKPSDECLTNENMIDVDSSKVSSENLINFEDPKEDVQVMLSNQYLRGSSIQTHVSPNNQLVRNEEGRLRLPSDVSSAEELFCDCDSFKSCSSTFMDESSISHPSYQTCIQEADNSFVRDLTLSNELETFLDIESYDSDLDSSNYEKESPCLLNIKHLVKVLKNEKPRGGFFYAFGEKWLGHQALVKIGASRNPEKKLLQALIFNTRLTLLKKIRVKDMETTLKKVRERLKEWEVIGHPGWYVRGEEVLCELQSFFDE